MKDLDKLHLELCALTVFGGLKEDDVIKKLAALLEAGAETQAERVRRYSAFAGALFLHTDDLGAYVRARAMEDDNVYVRARARQDAVSSAIENAVKNELETLGRLAALTPADARAMTGYDASLPEWKNSRGDLAAAYEQRMAELNVTGYGLFAQHHVFTAGGGGIVPVGSPDRVSLDSLFGYARQRQAVIDNTLALIEGRPAANVLLYGDAGTGKSSTVKAVANAYAHRGLRLIEIAKNRYADLPGIAGALRDNPLKFILFIDDLSFANENDDFYALKAVLEGTVFEKAPNAAVYATSNRRHLIKETFSDRKGDDVHRDETIQELCALSARFGLQVGFFRPDKKKYLEIVHAIARQYGVVMDGEALELEAERFADAGRSPRAARQFIDRLRRDGK